MDNERADNPGKDLAWFGFVLKKQILDNKRTKTIMDVQNNGMPFPEVILHVEAWLDRTKADFKKDIQEKFYFSNKDGK